MSAADDLFRLWPICLPRLFADDARPFRRPDGRRRAKATSVLKLLHVIASVDPVSGGPIEGLLRQAAATKEECTCEIASLDHPNASWVSATPVKVHALGGREYPQPLRHWGYSPSFAPWLRQNSPNYDAIIVNGLWNYAAFGAARVLPHGPTPYFVFTHGMMDPWFRQTYPLKHAAKQAFWTLGEGRLMAGARRALFTTEDERRLARGQFYGHRYREAVVGYGTSAPPPATMAATASFKAAAPRLRDRPFLLFLSRIHEKKGCDLLIAAFAEIADLQPDLQLVIAGPGAPGLIARLQRQAASLGIADRIHWPGMLSGETKWGAFHTAEAFVLSSHQENFGVVVAEALGCGKPVWISDKANIWREVTAANAGLVEPDTLDGAANLLRGWLALDQAQRAEKARNAVALFEASFDITKVGPALIAKIRNEIGH